ncbi:MAG: His/Gly/Thr/Pro-type tRNA ligase C-terminal domain-containing protein, partial [Thermoguttaceae bacterium]
VSPKFEEYAQEIEAQLRAQGFRVQTDCRSEKIGAKIRRAQIQLVPYMIIIGEREASQKTLAIRDRISGNLGNFTLEKSVEMFLKEIREKTLKYEPGTV